MLDQRFINPQIREFEEKRFFLYERAKREDPSIDESVFHEALPQFVQWYIQKSINAQMKYAENLVRAQLRENDKKAAPKDLEEAIRQDDEASKNVVDDYLAEASYKKKAVSRRRIASSQPSDGAQAQS